MSTTMPEARREARRLSEHSTRRAPFALRAVEDGQPNDGFTLDGYGAVFNTDTVINSWEGKFRERIAPGAMKKSFRENPPIIQFDHGHHSLIGSIPVAELTSISEDSDPVLAPDGGAHVIGRMFDNWLVEPLRDAIRAQAIKGMSFRFEVVREEWRTAEGKIVKDEDELYGLLEQTWFRDVPPEELLTRTLKELKVPEVGPVVWPAYVETSVSVRSGVIDLARLNDPEQRKLLARAVVLVDTADNSEDDSERSEDEPQDTPDGAVEHSDEDNDTPQTTDTEEVEAGEHESESTEPAPVDDVDAARAAAFEQAFTDALNEVKTTRESTPSIIRSK
jgi:HK97 family phage prohead protease